MTGDTLQAIARDLGFDPDPRGLVGDWLPSLPHRPTNEECRRFAQVAHSIEIDAGDWRTTLTDAAQGCDEDQRRYLQHWALLMIASPPQTHFPRFPTPGF